MARTKASAEADRRADAGGGVVEAATLTELGEGDRVRARVTIGDGLTAAIDARVARLPGYRPAVGDRVLVARGRDEAFVVGVLAAAAPPALALADGSTATLAGEAIEIRDGEGRLLVRHEAGVTTIAAPERDLRLVAPYGKVVLEAGTDVAIHAARDVHHGAGRKLGLSAGAGDDHAQVELTASGTRLATPRVDVETRAARLVSAEVAVVARAVATTAEHLAQNVGRYELTAERLVEKTRDAFRDVVGLLQQRVGRAKTVVDDVYSLHSRRTTLVSTEETSVDGKKILLG